ncbi:hypothetical protein [Desulfuromusa kysingii]|nr:hypothetical protein [Desulfuromusa kysingii]
MIETLNTSAATFRNAFADEIAFLGETINEETIFKTNTFDVLTASREKHERAISVFKSTLGNGESSCLEKAWCKYQYPNGEPESAPCPFVDYISDGNKELEIKARKAALQNIANILKLAATK